MSRMTPLFVRDMLMECLLLKLCLGHFGSFFVTLYFHASYISKYVHD